MASDTSLAAMRLREIHIINFKSIASASCHFSDKLNCFIGLNGMGKTNVLDALHYLSFTKSHLSITDALAVRRGEESAILDASYIDDAGDVQSLLLQIKPGSRKVLRRNKKEYQRFSEHIGRFPLVIVSPEDYQLILGGSDERRRFVDQQLSQQDAVYLNALSQYQKALLQRNTLLKEAKASDAVLDVLDMQLDRYARIVYERRQRFVQEFSPHFQHYYTAISSGAEAVSLEYVSALHDTAGELLSLLHEARARDRSIGFTTQGIHKDELLMLLDGTLMRKIGSQGQNKTFVTSLKLAQYTLLSLSSPERPILLLDDIFDKLDAERVERIVQLVSGEDFGQIFITDTNRKYLDEIVASLGDDYRLFEVSNGVIQAL